MDKKKKHIKKQDEQLVQYYLEELSQVRLLDRHKLRKVHTKLENGLYFRTKVFEYISESILEEKTYN